MTDTRGRRVCDTSTRSEAVWTSHHGYASKDAVVEEEEQEEEEEADVEE